MKSLVDLKYLFVVKENLLSVFFEKDEKLHNVEISGELEFPVFDSSENLWKWWKEESAYRSGQQVDFCFLADKQTYFKQLFHHDFPVKNSTWSQGCVHEFLKGLYKTEAFTLCDVKGDVLVREICNIPFVKSNAKVYSNLKKAKPQKNKTVGKSSKTPFQDYFSELWKEQQER